MAGIRYICTECGARHPTARGHAVHANRDHSGRVPAERRHVDVLGASA